MSVTVHDIDGDISVTSSDETEEQIRLALAVENPAETPSGETPVEAPEPSPEPEHEPEPELVAKPGEKLDRRTREGKLKSIQIEIDKETARRHKAREEADAEEARLAAIRAQRAAVEAPPRREPAAATLAAEDPEPTIEQFKEQPDPYTAWMRAVARWEGRTEYRNQAIQQQRQQAVAREHWENEQKNRSYFERMSARITRDPDFAKKLDASPVGDLKPFHLLAPNEPRTVYSAIADQIMTSEIPDKLAEFLIDNPSDFQRLATLNPRDLVRAIGKIEARLEAVLPGPAQPAISTAKPLIKPVGASPVVSDEDVGDDEDLSEAAILRHHKRENSRDPRVNYNVRHR